MSQFREKTLILQQKYVRLMTEIHKKYRLTSMEEPTDEMLQELMEDVAKAARESSARAEAEKQRRTRLKLGERTLTYDRQKTNFMRSCWSKWFG